jgi:DNA-binding transcriptional LysR family regulator
MVSRRLLAEPFIMSELTVGYGQVVFSLFTDLGIRPNLLAVADNIETMKMIVQAGGGIAIVPRAQGIRAIGICLLHSYANDEMACPAGRRRVPDAHA